ncbi:MAG: hypothetical protein QXX17_01570 [Conexivisphaerales archaeon]
MAFNYYNLAYLIPLISVIVILIVILAFFPISAHNPTVTQATTSYSVTFVEVGLPPGLQWGVNFNGHQLNSTGYQNQVTMSNVLTGNYVWTAWSIPCGDGCEYSPTQLTGSLNVPGQLFQIIHYIKQYKVNVAYSLTGNPPLIPKLSYMSLGSYNTMQLSNTTLWIDSNSFWYASPATIQSSNGVERWITNQAGGVISGPQDILLVYYNQYLTTFNILTTDNSVLPTPVYLTVEAFGSPVTHSVSVGENQIWADSAGGWKASSIIKGSSNLERWLLSAPSTGTINGATTIALPYVHQYYLQFLVLPQSSGTVNVSNGWFNAGKFGLSVVPSSGFSFDRWYTDSASIFILNQYSQTTDVLIHGAGNITAVMSKPSTSISFGYSQVTQQQVSLTIETTTGGSVTYSYGQTTGSVAQASKTTLSVPTGSSVCLTALALPGYSFTGWNNSLLGNSNPYCFTVYTSLLIQADFAPTGSPGGGSTGGGNGTQSVPEFPLGSFPAVAITFVLLLLLSSTIRKRDQQRSV